MLSRVADSCFWLSRYLERAETNSRILDVNIQIALDFEENNDAKARQQWMPILASAGEQELFHQIHGDVTSEAIMDFVTFEKLTRTRFYLR